MLNWFFDLEDSDKILLVTLLAIVWYTIETTRLRRWQQRATMLNYLQMQTVGWNNIQKAKSRFPLALRGIMENLKLDTKWGFSRAYHGPVTPISRPLSAIKNKLAVWKRQWDERVKKNGVTIIFESHATTSDNENHVSSGHNDVELSPLGIEQAKELGERRRGERFDAIFCSDLQRSYRTGEIAFEGIGVPIIRDARLREVDYGDMTQHPADEVTAMKPSCIDKPFPNGESYEQSSARMKSFLDDLARDYDGKRVMIIGHRATQYALEHWINGVPLSVIVPAPWKWQPGWEYVLDAK